MKSLGVLAVFLAVGVALPNLSLKDKDSPYKFPAHQMGPYEPDAPRVPATVTDSEEQG